MANTMGSTEVAGAHGGVALAERTDAPRPMWLSALPTLRQSAVTDLLPQLFGHREVELADPIPVQPVTIAGVVPAADGPITDLAISSDGRSLVATHYSTDVVSVIDTATLAVTATTTGVSEPYAVSVTDRAYVSAASASDDAVVAVDIRTGAPLAATLIDNSAGGTAVSPTGDVLYVARRGEDIAEIAVIDIESGHASVIEICRAPGASVDAVSVCGDGSRLCAVLTTGSGSALATVDLKSRALADIIWVTGSIADIAVHPNGRTVYASGWDVDLGGVIQVIDTVGARVVDTIVVGGLPTQVAVAGRGESVYVIDRDDIVVLSTVTNEVVDCIIMGRELSCLAASADGTRLYVADFEGGITALRVGAADSTLGEILPDLLQLDVAAV